MAKKPIFWPDFDPFDPKLGRQTFFFKTLASPITRYHGQILSEKTNDPILRKPSDGRTDGKTDGRE